MKRVYFIYEVQIFIRQFLGDFQCPGVHFVHLSPALVYTFKGTGHFLDDSSTNLNQFL